MLRNSWPTQNGHHVLFCFAVFGFDLGGGGECAVMCMGKGRSLGSVEGGGRI